ncbi:MAG: hypothetical protein U1F76_06210 [Candidatus Competibacteraceae bacterium]
MGSTQDCIFQGKLDIQSLRAITGQIETQLAIFVEDPFAKVWIEAMLRQAGGLAMDHIQIHTMEGDRTAVAMNVYHNKDPSTKVQSICFIDGDSKQTESAEKHIYRLPGESPEAYVFDEVISSWDAYGGKLAVALLQRYEHTPHVKQVCDDVRLTNMDPHLLFARVGERLGLLPEATVVAAFANIWAQAHQDVLENVLAPIKSMLLLEKKVA